MIFVAGSAGGGKSSALSIKQLGIDWFNADDRAAELNAGSYHKISTAIRQTVGRELERFIRGHIEARRDLAFETTLRSATHLNKQNWRTRTASGSRWSTLPLEQSAPHRIPANLRQLRFVAPSARHSRNAPRGKSAISTKTFRNGWRSRSKDPISISGLSARRLSRQGEPCWSPKQAGGSHPPKLPLP